MFDIDSGYHPVAEQPSFEKAICAQQLKAHMTGAEKALWARLRAGRLGGMHFRRQCVIRGFIVDFYCHVARLVVELDGEVHDLQKEYDEEHDRLLSGLGLQVVRYSNQAIEGHLDAITANILDAARRRVSAP